MSKRICLHPERERRQKEALVRKEERAKRSAAEQKRLLETRGHVGCKEWMRLTNKVVLKNLTS